MPTHTYIHLLFLTILTLASATQHLINVTVENTDLSISYWPPTAWHRITNKGGSHDGLDLSLYPGCASTTHRGLRTTTRTTPTNADRGAHPDLQFDHPITLRVNFTGSAVYVFGILFPGMNACSIIDGEINPIRLPDLACSPYTPIISYLGLSNDEHQLVVTVPHDSAFLFDYLIYTRPASFSSLRPRLPPNNEYPLIKYITRSSNVAEDKSTNTRKHNITTFAAAIGGSVGALGTVALCLALNIIRRRRLAAQRDREDASFGDRSVGGWGRGRGRRASSLHTDASEDSPTSVVGMSGMYMVGPAPFVPRFFPGTALPLHAPEPPPLLEHRVLVPAGGQDPPPYVSVTTSLVEMSNPAAVTRGEGRSPSSAGNNTNNIVGAPYAYADFPPPTPPPPHVISADPNHFEESLGPVPVPGPAPPPGLPLPFTGDDVQSSDEDGSRLGLTTTRVGGSPSPLDPVPSVPGQDLEFEGGASGGCEGVAREQQ